ncbi:hypothetical protein [Alcaligenes endophyticus]|uniref:Uncharacterized protein n=1 Tax=Alcaligenes endophyticus TaxID=1929088 RepID=A0ABT8EJY6_9BURK|nr:hypothetical protein [Alcaligenes endophyticus]MCX5591912.1 hypothetical protein [Alcaligenes endophyticus]MDN4121601.1 hypothetical protein [Alcaligenes endophyticus]
MPEATTLSRIAMNFAHIMALSIAKPLTLENARSIAMPLLSPLALQADLQQATQALVRDSDICVHPHPTDHIIRYLYQADKHLQDYDHYPHHPPLDLLKLADTTLNKAYAALKQEVEKANGFAYQYIFLIIKYLHLRLAASVQMKPRALINSVTLAQHITTLKSMLRQANAEVQHHETACAVNDKILPAASNAITASLHSPRLPLQIMYRGWVYRGPGNNRLVAHIQSLDANKVQAEIRQHTQRVNQLLDYTFIQPIAHISYTLETLLINPSLMAA